MQDPFVEDDYTGAYAYPCAGSWPGSVAEIPIQSVDDILPDVDGRVETLDGFGLFVNHVVDRQCRRRSVSTHNLSGSPVFFRHAGSLLLKY